MTAGARVTVLDVARHAGVSRATVSLVLQDNARISKATKARVRKSIEELGYRYNRSAANLRGARSMAVGLVLADVRDNHFAEMSMAIQEKLDEAGYSLFIAYTLDDQDKLTRLVDSMFERQVDGLILLPAPTTTADDLHQLFAGTTVPHVLIGRRVEGYASDFVSTDYVEGARMLGEVLRKAGVARLVIVGGYPNTRNLEDRIYGLRQGLGTSAAITAETTGTGEQAGITATRRLLADGDLPPAIVAYTDTVALGVYDELARHGLMPGRDVLVVGFDNSRISALLRPPLTTVRTSPTAIGQEVVSMLLSQIASSGRLFRSVRMAPVLQLTESVGTAPR